MPPPLAMVTYDFFIAVLKGEKKLLYSNAVSAVKVKRWPEINMECVQTHIDQHPEAMKYVPDEWWEPDAKKSKEFMLIILLTLEPQFMSMVINHCV